MSSNFERLLFEASDRNAETVSRLMETFKYEGVYKVPADIFSRIKKDFSGVRCNDEETKAEIGRIYKGSGELLDPHSAIGATAAEAYLEKETPTVVLATAHPSKFPVPVREATGITPSLPSRLSDLLTRKEVFTVLPNSLDAVKYFIQTHVRKG